MIIKRRSLSLLIALAMIIGVAISTVNGEQKTREALENPIDELEGKIYLGGLLTTQDPDVKRLFWRGIELYAEYKFEETITAFEDCLLLPNATLENKTGLNLLIGYCYYNLSDYKEAKRYYEEGLKIAERIEDESERLKAKASAYNNIGEIHYSQGNFQEALEWHEKSRRVSEKIGDQRGLTTAYNNIGLIYYSQGNYQEALEWYERSIGINKRIRNQVGLAATYNNIGEIHYAQGNFQEALEWLEKSRKIIEEIGHQVGLVMNYNSIGAAHYSKATIKKR